MGPCGIILSLPNKRGWDYYPFDETIPFKEFVKNWLKKMPGQTTLNTNSCYDWISDENDDLLIDFIEKLKICNKTSTICDKIKIPQQQLPHKNKSKHKHYRILR